MKRIFLTFLALASMAGAMAQNTKLSVPMGVYLSDDTSIVPEYAKSALENKMRQIVTANGMGANNSSTFFITCDVTVTDKEVLGGAPVKVIQRAETTFYIADAQTERLYESVTISNEGIGNSDNEAFINAFKQIDIRSSQLRNFVNSANKKIIEYYESQIDNYIAQAEAQAKLGEYESALYILSTVPDCCEGYDKVNDAAVRVYQIMIDQESLKALQHAKSAWTSAHSREAAAEAGGYLAEVSPYSSCYVEAESLAAEIKKFVVEEHAYDRKMQEEALDWERKMEAERNRLEAERTKAWRDVGVAYGNNQQPVDYTMWWRD